MDITTGSERDTERDHQLLIAIHQLLDGVEWDTDTLNKIALLLDENGYPVRGPVE